MVRTMRVSVGKVLHGGGQRIFLLTLLLLCLNTASPLIPAHAQPSYSLDSATTVSPGSYTYTLDPAVTTSHYFRTYVLREATLTTMLTFNSTADFDLYVYDPYKVQVASAESLGAGLTERLQHAAAVDGYYCIEVRYRSGTATAYTLTLEAANFKVLTANWVTSSGSVDAGPGDKGANLAVTVRSENNYTVTGFSGVLNLKSPFTNVTGGLTASSYSSSPITSGQTMAFTFTLNVAPDALVGVYTLTLSLSYYSVSGSALISRLPVNLTVPTLLPGKSLLQVTPSTQFITAGAVTNVNLTVRNSGTAAASAVELTLTVPPPLALETKDNKWYIQAVNPGESIVVACSLYAPISSVGNTYQLTLSFAYTTTVGSFRTESRILSITVSPSSDIPFSLFVSGQILSSGMVNPVALVILNNGDSAASSLELTLTLPSPLTLVGKDNRWFTSSLMPGSNVTLTAQVYAPPASQGNTYAASLGIKYTVSPGVERSDVRAISLTVAPPRLDDVVLSLTLSSSDLKATTGTTVSIEVDNEGRVAATSLTITLTLPSALTIVEGDNQWFIEEVTPGGKARFSTKIYAASTSIGVGYQATLTLKYKDAFGQDRAETRTVGLTVRGFVDLYAMGVGSAPSPAVSGKPLTVSGSLINEGIIIAKSVNVTVKPSRIFRTTFASSSFVGEIPVGLQAPFSVTVEVDAMTQNGTYELEYVVYYRDDRNNLGNVSFTIPVTVSTAAPTVPEDRRQAVIPGLYVIFIAAVGVACFVAGYLIASYLQRRRLRVREEAGLQPGV